jgi:transcription initiation factor TFIID subunit 5
MTNMPFHNLVQQMEAKEPEGGAVILTILSTYLQMNTIDRAAVGPEWSIQAMLARSTMDDDLPAEDEGIPGHAPGHPAGDGGKNDKDLPGLRLGAKEPEQDLKEDVTAELQQEDAKNPPAPGQPSLMDVYEQRIKREPTEEHPGSAPFPPSMARDVQMEVAKVKEHRDRFKIDGRTTIGSGYGVSVCMFTFHNTFDSVCCIDFSGDQKMVAVGTSQSYIRVWSLDGEPLPGLDDKEGQKAPSSRRLYGHSGAVYQVSFSPAIADPGFGEIKGTTSPLLLLSASGDKTIRLWSLDSWSNLVVYKAHDSFVWDVQWSPYGHYFLSGSHDRTARLWATEHIAPLKMYVGHDDDVSCVAFHPNVAYVFTGSYDKTVRMWHINSGACLRLFTSHTSAISAIACSVDGKTLASGDYAGNIILWDLESGKRKKRMRGHGNGGVYSLSWSAESTALISGGADGTVRIWDAIMETAETGKVIAEGGAGTKIDAGGGTGAAGGSKKGKAKEQVVTADQVHVFPTKKTPVLKAQFTRMNLAIAGGNYQG